MNIVVQDPLPLWRKLLTLPAGQRIEILADERHVDLDDENGLSRLRHEFAPFLSNRPDLNSVVEFWEASASLPSIGSGLRKASQQVASEVADLVQPGELTVDIALLQLHHDGMPEELLIGAQTAPDYLWLACWPTSDSVGHLAAGAAHEFNHILRSMNAPQVEPFTVGDWVISEGLAESFVLDVFGPAASYLSYSKLDRRDRRRAWDLVLDASSLDGGWSNMAYVLGDPTAIRNNVPTVGMPHMGGYAVGKELIDRYRRRSVLTAVACLTVPTTSILQVALAG